MRAPSHAHLRGLAAALVALVLAAGLLVGDAGQAGAHATLVGTAPAADEMLDAVPEAVELRFDEPVETTDGAVEVFGPDGDRVDRGAVEAADGGATLRVDLDADPGAAGTYTVAWRVTSEDSHTLTGSFVFHNGTRTGAVDVEREGGDTATDLVGAAGRWAAFAGLLVAVGAASLALVAGRPRDTDGSGRHFASARNGRRGAAHGGSTDHSDAAAGPFPGSDHFDGTGDPLPGSGHPDEGDLVPVASGSGATGAAVPGATDRSGGTLTAPSTVAGSVTSAASPSAAPAATGVGADAASRRLRTLTVAGAAAGAVGAFVALVAMLAESAGRDLGDALTLVVDLGPDTHTGRLGLARIALALVAAAAAGIAAVWRRSVIPALVPAAAALLATSLAGHAWTAPHRGVAVVSDIAHLGAVAVWVGGLVALLVVLPLVGADQRVRVANRFSALALGAVVLVAVSGTVSGWQQVRSVDALTSTTYGRLLLAKVAGFAVLVVLGWLNRSRLVPVVARTVAPLQRSLRIETVVAALVLAVTAALVQEPPARTVASSGPYDATVTAEGGQVLDATVDPATAGANDIHLYFYEGPGSEPLAVDAVQVTAATADVPARRLQVTPVTTNHVTVAGASLPSPGTWTVEVTAVQAGEPLIFTFEVPVT